MKNLKKILTVFLIILLTHVQTAYGQTPTFGPSSGASYTLPTATSTTLGGVKPDGTTITNASGAISTTYGTTANTAAQGNDARITGALSASTAATTYAPLSSPPLTGAPTINGAALSAYGSTLIFGTGADGSVTISSGTTTLTRDMHYTNLTISGTGSINAAGYRIFVSNKLDLSAAGANAIYVNQFTGNNASGATAGSAYFIQYFGTFISGPSNNASAGATATTAAGTSASTTNGGGFSTAGGGGAGGTGTNTGGTATATTTSSQGYYFATPTNNTGVYGARTITTSSSGTGGSAGGGDGTNTGGGGGSGCIGGYALIISARYIQRGTNTTTNIIQSLGGIGGNGGNSSAGNTGGGGGGGGGSGGLIYIISEQFLGSVIPNALNVSGGAGGLGGNGFGTGKGGQGGQGGGSGAIQILNLSSTGSTTSIASGSTMSASGFNASTFNTAGTAAVTATTTAGTAGGAGATLTGGL